MATKGAIHAFTKALTQQPEELAPAYLYFASENDSSYVSGEVLAILGGQSTAG
ncbi:MAG: hypothetical protein JJD97_00505 [Gemmatimonadaceae bacterium]|nr:hypothetical protein [Gemmatimonadaceae bacterium]